jgi:spermidine synthase
MPLNHDWFTEVYPSDGTAFSLKIKQKVHEEQSPYQRVEIYETEHFGTLMVIDGCVMLSDRDNFLYHEMLTHPVLFTHPEPRRVLIIGGGDCGTLREVLKHPSVQLAHMVEIDERVTRLAEQFFPELCCANNDPRAHIHFADGIKWVADADPAAYDVIIVDSTDPVGPAAGLFAEPFYKSCLRALGPDGIFVQQSESPLLHGGLIKSVHGDLRKAGLVNVQLVCFPQPVYPSGWWSATMASAATPLTRFRNDSALAAVLNAQYYNADIHSAALAVPEFLRKML